jgi:uncharacterized protein (TIGR03545 family)
VKRFFRFKALIPLGILIALVVTLCVLFLDTIVRNTIEDLGTTFVGARVDLEAADVRLGEGVVRLSGLQVTNPDSPMKNLFEVEELVADLRVLPLLEKKIFIDTVAVRGMQFGTERETSGAIDNPSPESQELRRQVNAWADRISIPDFSLEGLTRTVNVSALRPESLQTLAVVQQFRGRVDSTSNAWEQRIRSLNPEPVIDSARALAERLEGASVRSLGVQGLVQSVQSARSTVQGLTTLRDTLSNLQQAVTGSVDFLRNQVAQLDSARTRDIARARGLLQIPSLDAPELSPALFGDFAVNRIQPILYWLGKAERFLPPGLDPRRRPGPKRARLAGEDVQFPKPGGLPAFTLANGEASLEIGGEGAAAGDYAATISGLTSAPSLLGEPLRIAAQRLEAAGAGPDIRVNALLDHVTAPGRDSLAVALSGVSLPAISLSGIGAELQLGRGASSLTLARVGDSIAGRWTWSSSSIEWSRVTPLGATGPLAQVEQILWRSLTDLQQVDVEVRFSGSARGPRLAIRSNIADQLAQSLRRQLQGEIEAAEQRIRAEIDRHIAEPIAEARGRVTAFQEQAQGLVAERRQQVEEVREQLEARIAELTRGLPPGIRIPGN